MSYVVWGRQVTNDELWRWLHDIKEAKTGARQERNDEKVRIGSSSTQAKQSKANRRPIARCCHHDAVSSRRTLAPHVMRHWWRRLECDRRSPGIPAQVLSAAPPLLSHGGRRGLLVVVPALTSCPSVATCEWGWTTTLSLSFRHRQWVWPCGWAMNAAVPAMRGQSSHFSFSSKKSTPTKKRNEKKKESTLLLIVVLFAFVLGP